MKLSAILILPLLGISVSCLANDYKTAKEQRIAEASKQWNAFLALAPIDAESTFLVSFRARVQPSAVLAAATRFRLRIRAVHIVAGYAQSAIDLPASTDGMNAVRFIEAETRAGLASIPTHHRARLAAAGGLIDGVEVTGTGQQVASLGQELDAVAIELVNEGMRRFAVSTEDEE